MLKIWSFKPDEIIPFALTAVCQNYVLKCCFKKFLPISYFNQYF